MVTGSFANGTWVAIKWYKTCKEVIKKMNEDVNQMFSVDKIMQLLAQNDRVFAFCYQYLGDDVSDRYAQDTIQEKMERGLSEKEALAEYMASLLVWEPHLDKVLAQIDVLSEQDK